MEMDFYLQSSQQIIFYGRQGFNYQNDIELLEDKSRIEACSTIQNFSVQMEEIMKKFTYDSPISIEIASQAQVASLNAKKIEIIQKNPPKISTKKQKKIKKIENSPFHNYQKHLNNALKRLIIVPQFEAHDQLYKVVALSIWSTYCKSEIKTKRILHFIFNERNEHTINEPELKTYNLWGIYHTYDQEVISQAKNYLSKLAIDQLDEQNIEGYLKTRKLKSKVGFKEYIIGFKTELQCGYLKRRVYGEKTQN